MMKRRLFFFFVLVVLAAAALTFGIGRFALPIYPLLAAMPLPWGDRRC